MKRLFKKLKNIFHIHVHTLKEQSHVLYSNSKTQHSPIFIFPEIDWSFLKIVFYSTLNSTKIALKVEK